MLAMLSRRLSLPSRSFFLFGPRGTGKTTWLRSLLPEARWFNLLLEREVVRLLRDPGLLQQELAAAPRGSWVVIDEIQRLPALLDEVHDLLAGEPSRLRFALTGSSARKLRRGDVNLLAGRAITRHLFPLIAAELDYEAGIDDLLTFGGLPIVRTETDRVTRVDLLEAYVDTYLTQEVRAEALVRNLAGFTRFLEVAALANGQVTSVASLARDAAVARPTVQGHFDVLVDTLIGAWLPAWRPRAKVKEVGHSKFYFFDTGVVRALARRLREPIDSAERGTLLETWLFHELRAHIAYAGSGGELSHWRTPSGSEVDFVWSRGARAVGIEVTASPRWRSEHGRALKELVRSGIVQRGFAVYTGDRALRDEEIPVLPWKDFLRELTDGRIIGST